MVPIFEEQIKYLQKLVPDFRIVSAVVHLDEKSPRVHIIGIPIGRRYKRGMKKQTAKTKVFTQDSLTKLQKKMHIRADQDIEVHPEIFEGESLKDIEKGRNSDWPKKFFIRQKAETLEDLNSALVSISATVEATIQKLVETGAQKDFMRYAFLPEPKTAIGKLVSGAWKQFKS